MIEQKEKYVSNYGSNYYSLLYFIHLYNCKYIYSENHSMLMHLCKARNRKVKDVPRCLPFTSIKNLLQFNDANDEVYNEVVSIYIKNFINLINIKVKYIYIIYFIIKKSFLFSYLQCDSI